MSDLRSNLFSHGVMYITSKIVDMLPWLKQLWLNLNQCHVISQGSSSHLTFYRKSQRKYETGKSCECSYLARKPGHAPLTAHSCLNRSIHVKNRWRCFYFSWFGWPTMARWPDVITLYLSFIGWSTSLVIYGTPSYSFYVIQTRFLFLIHVYLIPLFQNILSFPVTNTIDITSINVFK